MALGRKASERTAYLFTSIFHFIVMPWQKLLSREGTDFPTISGVDEVYMEEIKNFFHSNEELFFSHIRGKQLTHYIGIDLLSVGRDLIQRHFKTTAQFKSHYYNGKRFMKEIRQISKEWKKKLEKENSIENLQAAFQEFRKQYRRVNQVYSIWSWWAIEVWQHDFEKQMNEMIQRNKLEEKQAEIMTTVYNPWKKTAILEIQEKLSKGVSVEKIVKQYQFLRSWTVVWFRPIDEKWVNDLTQTKNEEKYLTQKELFALLKPTKEEKKAIRLAPYFTFFKDWRDDFRRKHAYAWHFLFEKIAKHFKCMDADLGYLSMDEIENALQLNRLDKTKIEKRKIEPVLMVGNPLRIIDFDEAHQKIIQEVNSGEEKPIIQGTIGQKGIIRGKVIVIHSYHDIKRVQEGDILVTNTTHPNYLPAMQKAAAFVTNEGGIISHAAIVARELKKPCIVGTKIATQLLKDGDMVEVDADKGMVKKL